MWLLHMARCTWHLVPTCPASPWQPAAPPAGTKADLEGQRTVSKEEAQAYAAEVGALFYETSAKTNANVNDLFRWGAWLALCCLQRRSGHLQRLQHSCQEPPAQQLAAGRGTALAACSACSSAAHSPAAQHTARQRASSRGPCAYGALECLV
jgi:hypothetical protein